VSPWSANQAVSVLLETEVVAGTLAVTVVG
jgi:hypothetical protein